VSTKRRAWILGAMICFGFSVCAQSTKADEYYYAMIFGSQSQPKLLRYTHTWATFVRAVGVGTDPRNYNMDAHTISWLPRTLNIRTFWPIPEAGVNLDLHRTLGVAFANGEHVTMWGPFLISRPVYDRSLWIHRTLDSGAVQYRAISSARNLLVCIHAVAAVAPIFGRRHYPLIRIGIPASRYIARQIMTRSAFDQYRYDNSWLIPRLGLNRYPIELVAPGRIPKRNCVLCRRPV
jgi:hypothetical protein